MTLNEKAFEIYNALPHGAARLASEIYGTSFWYFKKLITDIRTPIEGLNKAVNAMKEASKKVKIKVDAQTNDVHALATEFDVLIRLAAKELLLKEAEKIASK